MVSSKDILSLANTIAKSENPLITVPSDIIRAALRAISARKRSNAYFESKTDGDAATEEKNRSHTYFISLMEQVVMVLQPRFATTAGNGSGELGQGPSPSSLEALENRFAALELEDLVESDDETTTNQPAPSSETRFVYGVDPGKVIEDLEQEKLFAVYCLFDDLDRLRTFVSNLWQEYKKQKIDLITASVVTNTAFQLAIRTQDEILAAYPEYRDYQDVLLTVVKPFMKAQGVDPREGEVEVDDDIANWIFAPVHSILDSFCEVLVPGRVPLMKRGHFGTYNPLQDRNAMSPSRKNREDLILLMEILPEFCFIAKYQLHLLATDELTRGLCNMTLTKEIPVWLAFATTVFLDIHHILREEVFQLPPLTMGVAAANAKETMKRYFELSRGLLKPGTWSEHNDLVFHTFVKEIDTHVLDDAILPLKKAKLRAENQPAPADTERFYLYMRHPILCGITAFSIMLEMQEFGVTLVNAMGTAIFPAQFYNALRQKPNPIGPWPLMDKVIEIHGEDRVFVGAKPTTLVDCFKQICLTLGVSAQNFARTQRKRKLIVAKDGPRGLKDSSAMNEIFKEGLRRGKGMSLTMHNIEELLNEQTQSGTSQRLRRSWMKTKRLSSIELLDALRLAISPELEKLKVNYFQLHEQSIGMLRLLKRDLDTDLKKFPGSLQIENESQLPFIGVYIVQAAMGTTQAAEDMKLPDASSKLLEGAGVIVDTFLRKQGEEN